jgi:hypothetical protein
MPRQTTGNAHDWTRGKIIAHLQLSDEEYEECWGFLEGFLAENGLLGQNFRKAGTRSRLIEHTLMKTLQTKDHREVPSVILNRSASCEGMRGLAGFSMKINSHHLIMERDRGLRERERALQQSYQFGHEDPQPSWPLSSTEVSPPCWTNDGEGNEECQDFLEHFLNESGLLGKRNSRRLIQVSLMEVLRTKAYNEVPRAILEGSTSCDGMHELVESLIKINNDFIKKTREQAQQSKHEDTHAEAPPPRWTKRREQAQQSGHEDTHAEASTPHRTKRREQAQQFKH